MKLLLTSLLLMCAFSVNYSQETPLQECSRFLSKSVDEASTCKIANKAKQVAIDKLLIQVGEKQGIIEALKIAVAAKNETIKILTEIKCSTTKRTFFFVYKITVKKCY